MVRMEETTSLEESERELPTKDRTNEVNLGNSENPRQVLISSSLNGEERDTYIELFNGFKVFFVWSYKEMSGLDPSIAVHYLNIRPKSRPHKPQMKFAPDRIQKVEA